MKIRTDFVTNSSSSSFVITLDINLKNGKTLSRCCSESMQDDGVQYFSRSAIGDQEESFDYNSMFDDVDMSFNFYPNFDFKSYLKNKDTKKFLKECISSECDIEDYEDDYEEDGEDDYYESDSNQYDIDLDEHFSDLIDKNIISDNDIDNIVMTYSYDCYGEGCKSFDEVIGEFIPSNLVGKIKKILDNNKSEEDAFTSLKKLDGMDLYTDKAINSIISIYDACTDNGMMDLTIVCTIKDKNQLDIEIE